MLDTRAEDLIFRRHALADGITDPELRRARTTGQLVAVAAGAYLHSGSSESLDAIGMHRAGLRRRSWRTGVGSWSAMRPPQSSTGSISVR